MAKKYLEKLSVFIEKVTADCSESCDLECKHFFSGAALYAGKKICLTLTPVGLAIKLPGGTKDRLLKSKKAVSLRYFPNAPIKKDYVLFPSGIEKGSKAVHKYVRESIDFVLTLPNPSHRT